MCEMINKLLKAPASRIVWETLDLFKLGLDILWKSLSEEGEELYIWRRGDEGSDFGWPVDKGEIDVCGERSECSGSSVADDICDGGAERSGTGDGGLASEVE